MKLWRLILREILHRKLNFALGLLSVSVAIACLVGSLTLLRADKIRTAIAGADYKDAMRVITIKMGFNIFILPEDQDLNELLREGTASSTMPESYVDKLANSDIVTINHLLPMVSRELTWPERDMRIILTGTRGEIPLAERPLKKPMQELVPPGTMVMGYRVHKGLNLSVGDTVTLLDKEFEVTQFYSERGTKDDVTVWINLAEAQKLLKMENLINAILALECNCAAKDRVGQIRQDIAAILPGTQVIERGDTALARAEARNKAKQQAEAAMAQHESFAAVLVPLVLVGCAAWIAFLTFGNVRQRSSEIGILRAIGLRSTQILSIFLGKALVTGLLGALLGYLVGFGLGVAWGEPTTAAETPLFTLELFLMSLAMAPLLAGLASWIPAMLAAQQDPAVVLQDQ